MRSVVIDKYLHRIELDPSDNNKDLIIGEGCDSIGVYCGEIDNQIIDSKIYEGYKFNTIYIAEGVEAIGESTFEYVSANKVVIPSSVKRIASRAFLKADIKTIEFKDNKFLNSIPSSCFEESTIENINIPSSVKIIDYYAFWKCKHLKNITFEKNSNLKTISFKAFYGAGDLKAPFSFKFPQHLTKIEYSAFESSAISEVVMDLDSSLQIEKEAFINCFKLSKIEIKSIKKVVLKARAFALETPENASIVSSLYSTKKRNRMFFLGPKDRGIEIVSRNISLENTLIKELPIYCFFGNTISSYSFSKKTLKINEGCFCCCHFENDEVIPDNVREIKRDAFMHVSCPNIKIEGVYDIQKEAFTDFEGNIFLDPYISKISKTAFNTLNPKDLSLFSEIY